MTDHRRDAGGRLDRRDHRSERAPIERSTVRRLNVERLDVERDWPPFGLATGLAVDLAPNAADQTPNR